MTPEQQKKHDKLQDNLDYFCEHSPMIINTKSGDLRPLIFNDAQKHVHKCLEKQLKDTGRVRAYVLKGRKQGVSTYVEARFYHKVTRNTGLSAFILCHEGDTTTKLFNMVKLFHDRIHPSLRPSTANSNRKELVFDKRKSDYFVGTAGNKDVGRGGTPQLFHGSEVAFWPNPGDIKKGLIQSIPDENGTEIIYESTARGMDAMFYRGIMDALAGKSEFQVIFIPWFWQEEYRKRLLPGFELTEDETKLSEVYDLDKEQIYWRRLKIVELGGIHAFKQEYPSTIPEAFEVSGGGLIGPEWIMKARENGKNKTVQCKDSPLVLGVDPADQGDRTVLAFRRAREFPHITKYETMKPMRLAGIIAKLIVKHNIRQVFIDYAHGHAVADRLIELGYADSITVVHFGEKAMDSDLYLNKRAEIWHELKEWIEREGVSIPDDEEIHADLACIPKALETSSGKKQLVAKKKIKEDFGLSPDIGDAMALTFSYPIQENNTSLNITNAAKPLNTNQRRRVRGK